MRLNQKMDNITLNINLILLELNHTNLTDDEANNLIDTYNNLVDELTDYQTQANTIINSFNSKIKHE